MEDETTATQNSVVGILRGFTVTENSVAAHVKAPEVLALRIDERLQCIDLALYKVSAAPSIPCAQKFALAC